MKQMSMYVNMVFSNYYSWYPREAGVLVLAKGNIDIR